MEKGLILENSNVQIPINGIYFCPYNAVSIYDMRNCDSLVELHTNTGLKRIDEGAFEQCRNLKSIFISETVREIGEEVFEYCDSLERIDVAENNPKFQSVDHVLFSKNMKKLIQFPSAKKSEVYQVPPKVKIICPGAFESCRLNEIKLPEGVKEIHEDAFTCCNQLIKINIPKSLRLLEGPGFETCKKLKEVSFPVEVIWRLIRSD